MSYPNNFEEIIKNSIDEFNSSNINFKAYYIPLNITEEGTLINIEH